MAYLCVLTRDIAYVPAPSRHASTPRAAPELSEEHVLARFVNFDPAGPGGAASQTYRHWVGVAVTLLSSPRAVFTNFHATLVPRTPDFCHASLNRKSLTRWNTSAACVDDRGGEIRRVRIYIYIYTHTPLTGRPACSCR